MIKKEKKVVRSTTELAKSIRGSWNGVNPVTKVERDRTKYTRKQKHRCNSYGA